MQYCPDDGTKLTEVETKPISGGEITQYFPCPECNKIWFEEYDQYEQARTIYPEAKEVKE